mmetsp:Transcript_22151/g.87286  ORF Transcript_22151/g.87286 Transcript_22151/m.87286 type:complete len:283 (-) Transcript_22151:215-1063(-)
MGASRSRGGVRRCRRQRGAQAQDQRRPGLGRTTIATTALGTARALERRGPDPLARGRPTQPHLVQPARALPARPFVGRRRQAILGRHSRNPGRPGEQTRTPQHAALPCGGRAALGGPLRAHGARHIVVQHPVLRREHRHRIQLHMFRRWARGQPDGQRYPAAGGGRDRARRPALQPAHRSGARLRGEPAGTDPRLSGRHGGRPGDRCGRSLPARAGLVGGLHARLVASSGGLSERCGAAAAHALTRPAAAALAAWAFLPMSANAGHPRVASLTDLQHRVLTP